ncbi:MAG: DEAD/DEAH box helicase, partial [Alphaproteobacteria bacterium]|nr:DEAD/DEAH box helicase [Alphaproteobacteria bacterium]
MIPADQPVSTGFHSLGLSHDLLRAVTDSGYSTPTPIQAQGIPLALQRRDMIGIAQTGTGKTAAFTLPLLTRLATGHSSPGHIRGLFLAPTRELVV